MPFRLKPTGATSFLFLSTFLRHFSSSSSAATNKLPRLRNLSKIPSKFRPQAVEQAQVALTDYLHTTRSLPFTYAEHISKNSVISLSELVSKVDCSPSTFFKSVQRFLRYHPINEFEFFYESIGIDHKEIHALLPAKKFFLSEDSWVFEAACALAGFGFPWNKLGELYMQESSIFCQKPCEINKILSGYKDCGFSSNCIIGICLVFPRLLRKRSKFVGEVDALFDVLKTVIIDYDLISDLEDNVDVWLDICRKMQLFYELGCGNGALGELMGRIKNVLIEHSEEVLVQKVEFFTKMGATKEEVGLLLLSRPEIMNFDLQKPMISVLGFLKYCGLTEDKLKFVSQKYPYVLGRNKMVNLPHVMRSLNLHEWFFDKVKSGDLHLLSSYIIGNHDEDLNQEFIKGLETVQSLRTFAHTMKKLDFLQGIGFGENKFTIKVLSLLHGNSSELQKRFDCLLLNGIEFSNLCKMINKAPKILNQQPDILEQKVKFLFHEAGSSLQNLDAFPAFLCYDLENRVKPRYRFHMWLVEKGFSGKKYSLASIIATSEKNFLSRISGIHPAALETWFKCFSNKTDTSNVEETLVS